MFRESQFQVQTSFVVVVEGRGYRVLSIPLNDWSEAAFLAATIEFLKKTTPQLLSANGRLLASAL